MVGDQLQLTADGPANRPQGAEVTIDREALQRQRVGAEVPPENGPAGA